MAPDNRLVAAILSSISSLLSTLTILLQHVQCLIQQLIQQRRIFEQFKKSASSNSSLSRYRRSRHRLRSRAKRSVWVKPGRTDQWWINMLIGLSPEEDWNRNVRMSRENFFLLVSMIRPYAIRRSSEVRKDTLSLEKKIAMTLYYLKDQGSFLMTCNTFGCAKGTLSLTIKEICHIIAKELGPQLIKFPSSKDEVKTATTTFLKKFGFPQVIGCVDGTHIPIKRPVSNAQDFFSYKMAYTINCQVICDHNGQFIDIDIKWPGSIHDARAFANSEVQKSYLNKKFDLFYEELLPGEEYVPQLLIRDNAMV